jgi:emp24/gp25L/p24 family/GOLD
MGSIKKNRMVYALVTATLIVIFATPVRATTMSFTVPAGQDIARMLTLAADDHVTVKFVVTGHTTNVLDFYMIDTHGSVTESYSQTGNVNIDFVCSDAGNYTMHFSNTGSTEDKLVSLDYEIQHYIFGMPEMQFMTIIIAVLCLLMAGVFIAVGKRR